MEPVPVLFAKLQASHIPEVLAIDKVVHSAPWTEQSFRNELTNPHSVFIVALSLGKVVGFGGAWLLVDEAHITNVAVEPSTQRRGIGEKICRELLDRSKQAGMICSTLEVRESNIAAIKLYEKLGFVQTNVRKKYYPDNQENAVVMWLHDLVGWKG